MNIEQSKRVSEVIKQHRDQKTPLTHNYCGHTFTTLPGVYSPFIGPSGDLTFCFASRPVFEGKRVLDVGCGSGLVACMAALSGAKTAVGVDISHLAIENAQLNARQLGVQSITDFRLGYLFEPLKVEEEFDIIFANLPFAEGRPRDYLEAAFYDPELQSVRRYIEELPRWLRTAGSRAFLCFSNLDDFGMQETAERLGLGWERCTIFPKGWIELSIIEL